jgi:hypothetical protein
LNPHLPFISQFIQVHFRQGQTQSTPMGTSWLRVMGTFTQLEAGPGGQVWGLTPAGSIQSRVGVSASNPTGLSWREEKPSGYSHITIGKTGVFAITLKGDIERCKLFIKLE